MTAENNDEYDVDPVCQMKVSKVGKVPPFMFHSHAYHFCADACREAFMADPEKYLKSKPAKPKGMWGRYVDRIRKATGGSPPRVVSESHHGLLGSIGNG